MKASTKAFQNDPLRGDGRIRDEASQEEGHGNHYVSFLALPTFLAIFGTVILASGAHWAATSAPARLFILCTGAGTTLLSGLLPLISLEGHTWAPLSGEFTGCSALGRIQGLTTPKGGTRFAMLQSLGWTVMGFFLSLSLLVSLNHHGRALHGIWSLLATCSAVSSSMLLASILEFKQKTSSPTATREKTTSINAITVVNIIVACCSSVASLVLFTTLG